MARTQGLTLKQDLFCVYFASDREFFGNGTQAYIEAFDIDVMKKGAYASARQCASALLSTEKILVRINQILEEGLLNDTFVDKQMAFLITQNAELGTKLGAIKEYNALKQRITKKLDVTTGGDAFEPIVVRIISEPQRDTDTE